MKRIVYLLMIVVLQSICVNSQTLDQTLSNDETLLTIYMSNYPLSRIKDIYKLSKKHQPAIDSLMAIVGFVDQKVNSNSIFVISDKYSSSSYGSPLVDIVDGEVVEKFEKRNLWSYITAHLNIVSEDLYSSKKICETLERVYCGLNHEQHIIYIKNHGQPYRSFIYLLYEGKYDVFKKIMSEDFRGRGLDGCFNCVFHGAKSFIVDTFIKYDRLTKEEAKKHPKVKHLYLSVLKYLEWDKDFVTMKKVVSELDVDFGLDSDFGKYRAMVAQ